MKHLLALALTLFVFGFTKAQSWAEIGTMWTYTYYPGPYSGEYPYAVKCIRDTLFQGKTCKVLSGTYYPALDTTGIITYDDSGKVFFFDNRLQSFQPLYDINAQPGQGWVNQIYLYPDSDSVTTIVDSIITVNINNKMLKGLIVHYNGPQSWAVPTYGDTIVEYIGNTYYMFPWQCGYCDAGYYGPLRCYTDSSIGFHDFETAPSCDYTVSSVNELAPEADMEIYPNPANYLLYIKTENLHVQTIKIYDIDGREVAKQAFAAQIDIHNLSPGVYLLKVSASEGVSRKRFIKM